MIRFLSTIGLKQQPSADTCLEWKPIETAPKDILLIIKGSHWRGRRLTACAARCVDGTWWMWDESGCCYPTHWLCVLED